MLLLEILETEHGIENSIIFGKIKISKDSMEFEGNFNVQKFNLIFFKGFFRFDIYFCFGELLWNFDPMNHGFP